ncbi:MAG: xanthine dehydrogenase family protein molybdopterin-binding subunit [Thermoanaerobaculia bacterium]|nr:xanthine dehydrogenase family protein molybdopterin-binding subunit [Thermoanaerobaculia bacterium]
MRTDRRTFIQLCAATSGALVLGVDFAEAAEETAKPFEPNAWLRIEPDGRIVMKVGKSEMGQGVRTSLPMILAEELDVAVESIYIEQASPGPSFKGLGTGGSGSIMGQWMRLRPAGAAARAMLVAAAAERWGVSASTLQTSNGAVVDGPTKRRATYAELASDAAKQPVPEKPQLKDRKSYRIVGTSRKRTDGPDIVTGRARYGIDVRVPGMLYAVVARAPQWGSKVESFDATAAKKVSGVRHVLQIPNGVAVVADNTWAAMRGREALRVNWTVSPHASFDSVEHMKALERAIEKPALTIRKDAEGRAAFEKVKKTYEATYSYPFAAHAALEPLNCTVFVGEGKATVWSPTQTPNGVHAAATQVLGLPESAITVNVMLIGGGFGRRLGVDFDREALEIAKLVKGTPVQLVWSREDDMRHGYFQAASVHRLAAGFDDEERLVAWEHRKASTPHNARSVPTKDDKVNPETVRGWAWGVYDMPYFIASAEMSYAVVDAPVPIGPWRAVFSPPSVFARECFIDEIAQETKRDPLKLRLTLLGADDPSVSPIFDVADEHIDRRRLRKVLETVAEKSGWATPVAAGRARGIACNVFHTETYIAYVVEVSLKKAGAMPFRVERVVCALDCGVAVNPLGVAQQVESGVIWSLSNMKSEITVRNGSVQQGFYTDFPVVMIDETPMSIETHIVASDDDRPHGLGEPAVCPFAPAVVNALSRLTGKRIRSLPVKL